MPHHGGAVGLERGAVELQHLAHHTNFDNAMLSYIFSTLFDMEWEQPLYNEHVTLPANYDRAHHMCAGAGYIWCTIHSAAAGAPDVIRIHRDDMTYDGVNLSWTPGAYNLCYDGTWIWVVGLGNLTRIDPDTLAQTDYVLPNVGADWICQDGTHLWIAHNTAPNANVTRVDLADMTMTDIDIVGRSTARAVVFDGEHIYVFTFDFCTEINRTTLALTDHQLFIPVGGGEIFCALWDGSYLWCGGPNAPDIPYIVRIETHGAAWVIRRTSVGEEWNTAREWPHCCTFDGRHVYFGLEDSPGAILKVAPRTRDIKILDVEGNNIHGVCYDGTYIWYCNDESPGGFGRFLPHTQDSPIRHGVTETFDTAAIGTKAVAVVFDTLEATPLVMVGLQDISDNATEIVSVEAEAPTTTGFTARCLVTVAGAALSTARFVWIAIVPELDVD